MAKVTPVHVHTSDQFPLSTTVFEPARIHTHSPAIYVSNAMGVTQTFYHKFCRFLSETYHAPVVTFDFRGMGSSFKSGQKLHDLKETNIIDHWAGEDLPAITSFLAKTFPERHIVHLGHSIGAHMAPLNPLNSTVHRHLFISASTSFHTSVHLPRASGVALAACAGLASLIHFYPMGWITKGAHVPRDAGVQWAKWRHTPKYCTVHPTAEERYLNFGKPKGGVLALAFSDDELCKRAGFEGWLGNFPENIRPHLVYVDPKQAFGPKRRVGHMNMFKESTKDILWHRFGDFLVHGEARGLVDAMKHGVRKSH